MELSLPYIKIPKLYTPFKKLITKPLKTYKISNQKMNTLRLHLNLHFKPSTTKFTKTIPTKAKYTPTNNKTSTNLATLKNALSKKDTTTKHSRILVVGAASLGVALLLMGFDEHKAMAFGPEGPLVEEFWDNMRRYGLYALSVSTGAFYALIEPIVELLKNPVSAVLIIAILAAGFFIVSQVVTAMVGLSDFSYQYSY